MENILFECSTLVIKDYGNGILYEKVIGNVDLEAIKILDSEMVKAIQKTKSARIVSDIRRMQLISNVAAKYNNDFLIPNWETNGVKYNAIIASPNSFEKFSLESIRNKYDAKKKEYVKKGFEIEIFDSEEEGIEWLKEQP